MASPRNMPKAFTLIEVLAALAMAAALSAALATTLHAAFTARKAAMRNLNLGRDARLALDLMGRDLQAVLPPTGLLAGAFIGVDENGGGGLDADTLSFFGTSDPARTTTARGDIRQVEFAALAGMELLTPTTDNTTLLIRRMRTDLLAQAQADPTEQILCRNVRALNMRYYDSSAEIWTDTWDSTTVDNALPSAVEITLEVIADDGRSVRLTRVVTLPCSSTSESSAESGGAS